MNDPTRRTQRSASRRDFLKRSGAAAAGLALASELVPGLYAAENNTIKVALVGCGGRGTGAASNALHTLGPTKLWAMADVFPDRLTASLANLSRDSAIAKNIDVPPERQFVGFDGYRKAVDSLDHSDVVIFATPPGFRPMHVEYAVAQGRNVFMEKSFAVDGPGVRRMLKNGEEAAKKNLKIAGGLMSRHYKPLEECVEQIHQGAIGEIITLWAYREHGPVGYRAKAAKETEMGHQIHNYSNYTWLNGSFLLDWLIHNLDVCCWVKDAWPVSAQGQGGRHVRTEPDQLFDHYAVEYSFADGTRLFAQGRHLANTWGFFGDVVHGAKGAALLGEGQSQPRIYKGHRQTPEAMIWEHKGPGCNHYQREHDLLFEAIRENKPYNETERCAYAALTGILGRMAAESGQAITWEQALASSLDLAPGIEKFSMDCDPPVKPDAQGRYPIAMPGLTKVL